MARRGLTCTVLDAAPSVRVYADSQAVSREVASPANDLGRTTIIKYDQMYLWASRDYRELVYGISGVYHTYIEPRSGAFVKVVDASLELWATTPPTSPVRGSGSPRPPPSGSAATPIGVPLPRSTRTARRSGRLEPLALSRMDDREPRMADTEDRLRRTMETILDRIGDPDGVPDQEPPA